VITERDLDAAIAECQGKRDPDSSTCIKLAAFYIIKKEMFGEPESPVYSYAPAPIQNLIALNSESEFARAIDGKNQNEILPIIDELMQTLNVIQPRLYNAVMNRIA
jgi:hypothetical protein